jgi:hypothetical protein
MFEEVELNSERWFDLKDLKCEVWCKPKFDYSNKKIELENYLISNYGRIKSYIKCNSHPNVPRIIKCFFDKKGYAKYNLIYNKRTITPFTHRLVAENFVKGKTKCKNQVNHIDGNKKNPRTDNLEWCDYYENREHAINNKLIDYDLKIIAEVDKNNNIISVYHGYKNASLQTKLPITNIYERMTGKIKNPRDNKKFKQITKKEELEWQKLNT